jgi:hypothetical protein
LLLCLTLTGTARAHRLDGDYEVLPNRKIKVTCWFETGDAPKLARVTVLRPGGVPLFPEPVEMRDGVLEFTYDQREALRVEISAGQGHHKVLEIPAGKLDAGDPGNNRPPEKSVVSEGDAFHPPAGPDLRGLAAGVGLLLGLAAFVISLMNARTLRRLREDLHKAERLRPENGLFRSDAAGSPLAETGVKRIPSGGGNPKK